jgi:hypothetical protein
MINSNNPGLVKQCSHDSRHVSRATPQIYTHNSLPLPLCYTRNKSTKSNGVHVRSSDINAGMLARHILVLITIDKVSSVYVTHGLGYAVIDKHSFRHERVDQSGMGGKGLLRGVRHAQRH